jgi:hypothetical protein
MVEDRRNPEKESFPTGSEGDYRQRFFRNGSREAGSAVGSRSLFTQALHAGEDRPGHQTRARPVIFSDAIS